MLDQHPESVDKVHSILCWAMIATAVPTFVSLARGIDAPYGRYSRAGWGIFLNARFAWMTQELPSPLVFLLVVLAAPGPGPASYIRHWRSARSLCAAAFLLHYTYRSLLFPLIIRGGKPTPLVVWLLSVIFCTYNGFLQGWALGCQAPPDAPVTWRTVVGLSIWAIGWINVMRADLILTSLRKPGETGYKIPYGGAFEYVSAGNYASEILEWSGFAIACGTLPAAAFAVFTFANLAVRGRSHHRWYKEKFREEYPKARRAIIPFVW